MIMFAGFWLCLSGLVCAQSNDITAHPFVVTGVVQNSNSALLLKEFSDYLSQHAGYPLKLSYAANYSELSKKMRDDPHAIGWTCGAPYVQDSDADKQQLVAVPTFKQKPTYYSVILTRTNRAEKSLSDFKGGVLAYSDPRSNSGYLSPKYSLYKQGINMETYFRVLLNAGNHEGSIQALLSGLADVAAVDEYIWVAYLHDFPDAKNKLHEIERMGPYPFTPIVASQGVSKNDINKLTAALVKMKNDKKGRELLQKFNLDDFVKKDTEFYNPIRTMLSKVEIVKGN